ncbi:MAG: PAS domain-containing protein [Candidatus Solibacter usitatus]|nr:PAS domain-containing protein [Candidatus Solibacter usitatus]
MRERIRLFGTDVSERAIEQARAGIYPESSVTAVAPDRLKRFFVPHEGSYQVAKMVRELCVFAKHDLTRDPPFSNLDLISCRNVLIYMGPALQRRIAGLFHHALRPGGRLFLGKSESLSVYGNLFTVEDRKHNILLRTGGAAAPQPEFGPMEVGTREINPSAEAAFDAAKEAERLLLTRYTPAALVVDEDLQIVHICGDTSAYLAPATGQPSFHMLKMVRPELVVDVRSLVIKARAGEVARKEGIRTKRNGASRRVNVEAIALKGRRGQGGEVLVVFQEAPARAEERPDKDAPGRKGLRGSEAARLEQELAEAREYLRSLIEDQAATKEEMTAANEEALSRNEELQSANEELETAKEELQSSNEELLTLNEELLNRNSELGVVTNDLINLSAGIQVPVVILDGSLKIRRFTPAAEKTMHLIPSDVGRPFTDIAVGLSVPDWVQVFGQMSEHLQTVEREVQDQEGHWYTLRVRPYRTGDHRIEGVMIVLLDVDAVRRSLLEAREALDYAQAIVETVREPLLVLDSELRIHSANSAFYRLFRTYTAETEWRLLAEVQGGQWDQAPFRKLLEAVASQDAPFNDLEMEQEIPPLGRRRLLVNARRIRREGANPTLILLAMEDITDRKQYEEALARHQEELAARRISVQEAETRYLARELHDAVSQRLAVLGMEVTELKQKLPASRHDLAKKLQETGEDIAKAGRDLHQISRRLHPSILYDLGLTAALKGECAAFSAQHGVPAVFTAREVPEPIAEEVALCLYRVAQEGLRNIGKHAGAKEAKVMLCGTAQGVKLTVADSGAGFNPEEARGKGGLGLVSMEERVRLVKGAFSIRSQPGKGTKIEAEAPLKRREE